MQQLTIFEAMVQFDESRANWKDVAGHFEKCTILAYIPKEALAPTEIPYRIGTPEWDHHKKIWGDYCTAIWHYFWREDNAWEKACRKLQKNRDEGKPCQMEIHRDNFGCFRPDHVVEYL